MNFYDFLKQKYEDFNGECESCPCKLLRYKIMNPNEQTDCISDIIHLANKYNVHNFNIYSCDDYMNASLEIAKKLFEKKSLIKYEQNGFL